MEYSQAPFGQLAVSGATGCIPYIYVVGAFDACMRGRVNADAESRTIKDRNNSAAQLHDPTSKRYQQRTQRERILGQKSTYASLFGALIHAELRQMGGYWSEYGRMLLGTKKVSLDDRFALSHSRLCSRGRICARDETDLQSVVLASNGNGTRVCCVHARHARDGSSSSSCRACTVCIQILLHAKSMQCEHVSIQRSQHDSILPASRLRERTIPTS